MYQKIIIICISYRFLRNRRLLDLYCWGLLLDLKVYQNSNAFVKEILFAKIFYNLNYFIQSKKIPCQAWKGVTMPSNSTAVDRIPKTIRTVFRVGRVWRMYADVIAAIPLGIINKYKTLIATSFVSLTSHTTSEFILKSFIKSRKRNSARSNSKMIGDVKSEILPEMNIRFVIVFSSSASSFRTNSAFWGSADTATGRNTPTKNVVSAEKFFRPSGSNLMIAVRDAKKRHGNNARRV